MKKLCYCFLFILISCSTSKVIVDYDEAIRFSSFSTFNFYDDVGKGLNELDIKRVSKAIAYEMQQKGFRFSDNPDLFINVIATYTELTNNNTLGIGSGTNNGGFGVSIGIPIGRKKLNEELVIELVNATTNAIIWEGVLNSTVKEKRKPEEKELHFQEIIKKILAKYPPK